MNDAFHVPDITARKNAGLHLADDFTLEQPLQRYSDADAASWRTLYARQMTQVPGYACDEFLAGLATLNLPAERIPRFAEINARLATATGWQIVAVHGLIPDEVFFTHLAHRRFPVTWWLREPDQLDYLQEPYLFHDLFGHVPLLTNPVFADYLQAYGLGGLKADGLHALPLLARLYWYTVEFGLLRTPRGLRIYGAGIVSSHSESRYALHDPRPHRIAFDLPRVLRTEYHIDRFQDTYFVIDSFAQLFDATAPDLTPFYAHAAQLPALAADALTAHDHLISTDEARP